MSGMSRKEFAPGSTSHSSDLRLYNLTHTHTCAHTHTHTHTLACWRHSDKVANLPLLSVRSHAPLSGYILQISNIWPAVIGQFLLPMCLFHLRENPGETGKKQNTRSQKKKEKTYTHTWHNQGTQNRLWNSPSHPLFSLGSWFSSETRTSPLY